MTKVVTKSMILDKLNGTNGFVTLDAAGPVEEASATMPLEIVLKTILSAKGLTPGKDCEVTDFYCTDTGIVLRYEKGEYSRNSAVPSKITDLFAGDRGTIRSE